MQNVIEAALNLRAENGIGPDDIEQVTIHRRGRGHSGPAPRSGWMASSAWNTAPPPPCWTDRWASTPSPTPAAFRPDMEDMLGRIRVEPEGPESGATLATAVLKDGTTVSAECLAFSGSASNPMSREQRLAKVRDCFHRALSDTDTERVLEMLENLERLDDIGELMGVLGQAAVGGS